MCCLDMTEKILVGIFSFAVLIITHEMGHYISALLFKITPGIKTKWVLSAESGPGEEDANGLIVPKYKTPEQIIRVGMNDEQLKVFASAIELLAHAWMREKINGLVLTQEIKM